MAVRSTHEQQQSERLQLTTVYADMQWWCRHWS